MKTFLIDEDLPRSLVPALLAAGMEAIHVIDAGLRGRSDSDVLAEANRTRRTLITADLDFSNLLQYPHVALAAPFWFLAMYGAFELVIATARLFRVAKEGVLRR